MGCFTYTVGDDAKERRGPDMPAETKTAVAAELRGRGLNSIAASLEGGLNKQRVIDRQDLRSQRGVSTQ